MRLVLDAVYGLAALLTAPVWIVQMIRRGKHRTDWPGRFGHGPVIPRTAGRPRLLIHAVSVGEVNAVRLLIDGLTQDDPTPEIVIAVTTDTGFALASAMYGERHPVVRYPLDFSGAVARFLDRLAPDVVALTELEVWPNFTRLCRSRGVPVVVVNGRLSARSHRRYRVIRPMIRPMFQRLAWVGCQTDAYAERFRDLGVPADRVHVLGTMKWDTAEITDEVPGAASLREQMGIDPGRPLVVAGSTAPDEHELLHEAVGEQAQLLCAPRKPEWFNEAASALPGCARRSRGDCGSRNGRFLLDTIGELRLAYALADIVVVGRTFTNLHGSDMIEPIALGKPVIVGPDVANFQAMAEVLLEGGGMLQVAREDLRETIAGLLRDPGRRQELACRGREVIRRQQGATDRHAERLRELLGRSPAPVVAPAEIPTT